MKGDKAWRLTARAALRAVALSCALVAAFTAPTANAGTAGYGSVSQILPLSQGSLQLLFFNLSSTPTGQPACATNAGRWVINVATPAGQAMASVILTAYSLGKQISVVGTGACSDWGDSESVYYIVMP